MKDKSLMSKIWRLCEVLRDDGISCIDYMEQFTALLFLKIVDEHAKLSLNKSMSIPKGFNWQSLKSLQGIALKKHYDRLLKKLSALPGMVGHIFMEMQNKIQDPLKLEKLIHLIDGNSWHQAGDDFSGNVYEKLVEKLAEDTKKGAGQYFTPRPLIQAIIACMGIKPNIAFQKMFLGKSVEFYAAVNSR